ncbi:MAG: S-methyl-5-thioribose-1-phosphate isomerase [Ardenticatenales bacterium]
MTPSTPRTVFWADDAVQLIDQRLLPARFEVIALRDVGALADAIRAMAVRGAPAIGAAAAYGMALAARTSAAGGPHDVARLRADLDAAAGTLNAARPTASNLAWAVDRMRAVAETHFARLDVASSGDAAERATFQRSAAAIAAALLAEAEAIAEADIATNRRMGAHGAALLPDDATVLHHCNTGALAAVDYGTALGVVRAAHEAGKRVHVIVDETRPRLQGAKLTCWELGRLGVEHTLIVDGAAAWRMAQGGVDAVLVGADRVAANGDAANKIGTYGLAIAAKHHGVPFYVVAPTSTIDLGAANGDGIVIEERDGDEVTGVDGHAVAPAGTHAYNPAFDVTPQALITAIVTEEGVVRAPFGTGLRDAVANARARATASARAEEATAA